MKEKLLEIAQRTKIIDHDALADFFAKQTDEDQRIDQALLDSVFFTEEQVLKLFAELFGIEYAEQVKSSDVPPEFVAMVPAPYAQRHSVVGIAKSDSMLTVATSRPLSLYPLDNVGKMVHCAVKPALASRAAISTAIDTAYEQRVTVLEEVAEEVGTQSLDSLIGAVSSSEDLLDVVNRPPVIRLVNDILFRALQTRASDVHIHPHEQKVVVRYRIDDLMYDMLTLDYRILPVVVSRIKVMAGMDIAERRMPQDGHCSVKVGQREVDLRVSTVPTSFGERTVLRLLDKSTGLYGLEELGMGTEDLKRVDNLLLRTHGVFLVTGPTGSGKSTTLYSFLQRIDTNEKNVITIEDPIEYRLQGISQIEVATRKGMTFVTALRHVLRQDPNIIMVGEIRDQETARMVIQSSLTGHLVFSTLHTNDSAAAVTRMLDLGIEPYLVSSSVIAVLAQRLIRRLCPDCKQCVEANSEQMAQLGLGFAAFEKIYQPIGCEKCLHTGYRGRTGIYELMIIDDDVRECIYKRESAGVIKKVAQESNMTTLRMDGLRKVEEGVTSLEEVMRVAHMDEG